MKITGKQIELLEMRLANALFKVKYDEDSFPLDLAEQISGAINEEAEFLNTKSVVADVYMSKETYNDYCAISPDEGIVDPTKWVVNVVSDLEKGEIIAIRAQA